MRNRTRHDYTSLMERECHDILLQIIDEKRSATPAVTVKEWGVSASQLDLLLLPVAGCGRLQLEIAHWAILVALL